MKILFKSQTLLVVKFLQSRFLQPGLILKFFEIYFFLKKMSFSLAEHDIQENSLDSNHYRSGSD